VVPGLSHYLYSTAESVRKLLEEYAEGDDEHTIYREQSNIKRAYTI
jgi:hypothetical protein